MPSCATELGKSSPLRLLTRAEYNRTVRDLLGDQTAPANDFPREPLAFGFDNNADLVKVTPEAVSGYLDAAEKLSHTAVTQNKSALISCPTGETLACGQTWVESFGRRAFRRPLTQSEYTTFEAFFSTTFQNEKSFDTALEWTLQLFLQSPQFLYRIEPSSAAPEQAVRKLTDDEMASRLSYFIWGSAPDDALLEAAANGGLSSVDGLIAQAKRLQADSKAQSAMEHFFSLWLSLDQVSTLAKDPNTYPAFSAPLAASLKQSMLAYANDGFKDGQTLKALLTNDRVFVDQTMAGVYQLPAPPAGQTMSAVKDASGHYGGLLGQPGLMALLSSPNQSSPVRRGLFVLRNIMCVPVSPPPPDLVPVAPAPSAGKTTRERFAQHAADPACAQCHSKIDPVGFGFEHFDGMGAWRDTDNALPVDASGNVTVGFDDALKGPFSTVAELSGRLADSRQVHDCFATQMVRYALGRVEATADTCSVQAVQQQFFDSGGRFTDLQLAIVASDMFRFRAEVGGTP